MNYWSTHSSRDKKVGIADTLGMMCTYSQTWLVSTWAYLTPGWRVVDPPSLPALLPPSLPPSLPRCLPRSLPPSLAASLPPSLPHCLTASLPPSLPPSLTALLPPSLPPSLPPPLPHVQMIMEVSKVKHAYKDH